MYLFNDLLAFEINMSCDCIAEYQLSWIPSRPKYIRLTLELLLPVQDICFVVKLKLDLYDRMRRLICVLLVCVCMFIDMLYRIVGVGPTRLGEAHNPSSDLLTSVLIFSLSYTWIQSLHIWKVTLHNTWSVHYVMNFYVIVKKLAIIQQFIQ